MSTSRLTPETGVYGIPTLSGAVVSPDGTRVVFARTDVKQETGKPETQLWIVGSNGDDLRQLTRTGTANTAPAWSPDGQTLAFVTRREGDKPFAIALLAFDGSEPRILVRHATAPHSLAFSPDGSTIAYVKPVDPENPDESPRDPEAPAAVRVVKRIDYKQDGIGYVNNVRNQVFLLDLDTDTTRQLTHGPSDHVKPDWSPDGARLAVIVPHRNGQRSCIGIVDAGTTTGETRVHGVEDGEVGLPSWSPDGTRIAVSFNPTGGHHHGLYLLDPSSGAYTPVVDDPDFLIEASWLSTAKPAWLDDATILLAGQLHGASGLWRVNAESGDVTEIGTWQAAQAGLNLPTDNSMAVQTSTSIDGEIAVIATTLDTAPERRVLVDTGADAFAEVDLASWERIDAPSDGFAIEAWVIKPPAFDPAQTYPVILDVHGGPHGAYGYGFNLQAQLMAEAGYVVILANPRGSTTYGRTFTDAVLGDWGDGPWRDLQAVLDAVLSEPWADETRTGVFGYSYGGYMASWIIGHTDRFRAAVIGAPVFDLESMFGTGDIGHSFVPEQNCANPWQDRDRLMAQSPSSFIHNAVTPTLIIHGEADERCPIGQGEQLFISLMTLGVETEFIRYPGGFHGFISTGEPAHRIDANTRILAWFDRFLLRRGERREK
ncbi:MAG: S9 family peptidase [Thermomicrobiales bacterium]